MQSISCRNASGTGIPVTNSGTGTALTVSATAATNVMLSQCFVALGQTATAYSRTPRYAQARHTSQTFAVLRKIGKRRSINRRDLDV